MNYYGDFWHSYDPDVNKEVQDSVRRIRDAMQTEWPALEPGTPAYDAMHGIPSEEELKIAGDIDTYAAEYGLDGFDIRKLEYLRYLHSIDGND